MIHFERKPTTRMTSRKARKYEPRRESQSSESVTVSSEAPSERKPSLPTPTIDAAAAKKTAEEALSAAILAIPNLFDDITPPTPKTATKRRASVVEAEDGARPTKLQILDQTLTSPASVAPVAPMFGRTASTAPNSAASTTAISRTATGLPTTGTRVIPDTSSIFPGFDIDPLLNDQEFEAQLDDEETVEDTLKMFTHAEQQLFSPPLSDGSASEAGDKEETTTTATTTTTTRGNEEYLRDTATEAWKLQLEEEIKVAG
ncbi:hypothetical protein AA313_de0200019 [Arthrobotrys entomopaga]|nr:hypothetical protein AA313_de0200019 [Arthrobotrys entomopaga]